MDGEFLRKVGVDLNLVLAGLCGGAVKALVMGERKMGDVTVSMLVGCFTSNYTADYVVDRFGLKPGFAGFVTGVLAMMLVQGAISAARAWRPKVPEV